MQKTTWCKVLASFDIFLGLIIATRAPFAEDRILFWSVLSYGGLLLLSGLTTVVIVGRSMQAINMMRARALVYMVGAFPFFYVLLLPMWTHEETLGEDLVFFLIGVVFFGLNSGVSIWLSHRLASLPPTSETPPTG